MAAGFAWCGAARGGEQPPAGKTLERQRQFFAGLGLTYSIGNTIIICPQTEICPCINHYSNTIMKRTMFITMLAAALVGSQVFADYIPTTTDAGKVDDGVYVGKYSQTADVSGANVTINEKQEGGEDFSLSGVYGGHTVGKQAAASNNSVTMTGGQVAAVEGGYSKSGQANNNKTTMTGGQVNTLSGGSGQTSASGNTAIMVGGSVISSMISGQSGKDASGNTAIMVSGSVGNMIGGLSGGGLGQTSASGRNIAIVAGDSVVSYILAGGLNMIDGAANDNKIYLVGKGATATIADAQGNTDTYRGGAISLNTVCGGKGSVSAGNSIDIYGTGITVSSSVQDMQILNFHIANLDDGATPMITLPSRLDLTNFLVPTEETPSPELALTFDALDSMEWKPGASVTLVNAGNGIGIDESLLGKEYNIYRNGDPDKTVLGTATLKLEQGEGTTEILKLVTNGNVPEPTTGILSLLALAALTARRRK